MDNHTKNTAHHQGHDHGHTHSYQANNKTLIISFIIISTYMVIEVIGGLLTNSLALLADAGHMLSDAVSLLIAIIAFKFSSKAADYGKSYGYKRFEILAALINGLTLLLISAYIMYEAVERFQEPTMITSQGMLIIASIGLLINILVAWIMIRGSDVKDNLNIRGAYLHVISDMLGSVGAIIAALLMIFFGWGWADPLASVIVSMLVLRSGYLISKSSLHVLMEGTPKNVDMEKVAEMILKTDGIISVYDLHILSITSKLNVLSCHATVGENTSFEQSKTILQTIAQSLEHFDIHHPTIQLETHSNQRQNSLLCQLLDKKPSHHHH